MNFSDIKSIASRRNPVPPPPEAQTPRSYDPAKIVEQELEKGINLSIVSLVDAFIKAAHAARASDVHLDPTVNGLRVRYRVDGVLQDAHTFPPAIQNEVISRLKILCGLRTDEHQAAQDGRFKMMVDDARSIDVRVSIVPTYYGENAVMRLLSDQAQEFSLDALGFTPENQKKILRAIARPHGMILATGPTGSGKTTTLYTLVKILNQPGISIVTLEDPIEYSISGINQVQINPRTELTFANGLRSMLRQDPNIIMVGEVRDMETAGLAVNTALTGHLVLSTLHTNDAPTTLPRLLDMKVEPYLIASTVNIAIGQRLVRKICEHCKEERPLTDLEAESLGEIIPAKFLASHRSFSHGKGCSHCGGTGYRGRCGVHEVMEITGNVRDAILGKATAAEIREIAIAEGMLPMVVDGFLKAAQGLTTIEEIIRMRYE
jgi:type IV pilus assembly protein PilB